MAHAPCHIDDIDDNGGGAHVWATVAIARRRGRSQPPCKCCALIRKFHAVPLMANNIDMLTLLTNQQYFSSLTWGKIALVRLDSAVQNTARR